MLTLQGMFSHEVSTFRSLISSTFSYENSDVQRAQK